MPARTDCTACGFQLWFKNEVDLSVSRVVFEKLCWKSRCKADRSVRPGETLHKAWPNPQHHKWKNHLEGGHQPNSCPMVEYQGRDLWMEGNQRFYRKTWGLWSQLWELQSPWHPVLCLLILWLYLQELAEDPTLHSRRAERESCALLWSSLFPLQGLHQEKLFIQSPSFSNSIGTQLGLLDSSWFWASIWEKGNNPTPAYS